MTGGSNAQASPATLHSVDPTNAARAPLATILVIEDDPAVARVIKDLLESEGYNVRQAASGARARAAVADRSQTPPDLIVLDLMLPDTDGLVLCADLKGRTGAPVVICSASPRKRDAILGLRLGADDFIAKPFHVDEFLTRIAAVLRRARPGIGREPGGELAGTVETAGTPGTAGAPAAATGPVSQDGTPGGPASSALKVGALSIEHARRRVSFAGDDIQLTPTEYRLLAALMERPDVVHSRQDLTHVVWGAQDANIGRSIDVHIHRLRTKLQTAQERNGIPGPTVVSVRGFGYKLIDDAASAVA
jgi:DNA-binding response OmpR family regulator